jgi:muconate cycloisomerase
LAGLIIDDVSTEILDIPIRRPHQFSVHTIDHQSYLLVRVRTRCGLEGLGEGVTPGGPWWGGDSIETMREMIERYLRPLLVDQDACRITQSMSRLDLLVAGNRFAKAPLEMALYDLVAKSLEVPVYELLGGLVHNSLACLWALATGDAQSDIDEAEARMAEYGHRRFKVKMGRQQPEEDTRRVEAIAKALAGRAGVTIDVNGAWSENTAARLLPRLEEAGVELIEQPIAHWNTEGMARLAERLRVPIMADESVCTVQDAVRLVSPRAADVFAVKIPKSGGITNVKKIAAVAEGADIACFGASTLESGLLTAASLHLYCTIPHLSEGCELFGPLWLSDDIITAPLTYKDGRIHVPHGPGFGVQLDEAKVRKYRRV